MPAVLTELEREILDYLVRYLRANTYQPSIREIGEAFNIKSTKTVSEHLKTLAEKGYLERDSSRSRGVRILGEDLDSKTVSVPCFASLPDDRKGFASDGVEAYFSMDRRMAGAKGCYFVRARDDEFSAVGVEKGDLLLVEPTSSSRLQEGDLVVVRTEPGPRLFRYRPNGRKHQFLPARSSDAPLSVGSPEELDLAGRVTGLYRSFEETAVPVSSTTH